VGQGPQRVRARKVLRRIFGEDYPTEEELSTPDLLKKFRAEYSRMEGGSPSKPGRPSNETVLREVGRKD
jgi:hypothetical protein